MLKLLNQTKNKWLCGAIPALLIHVSIGSVYCWSLLKDSVAGDLGVKTSDIEVAFSLAIFFLGMSAAFCSKFVEKNVTLSAFVSGIFFCFGLGIAALGIDTKLASLFILGYGVVMGIGLGIGYLTPVKTLMLWFKDNKGLAAGIAIAGFGLSKVIFSPMIEYLLTNTSTHFTILTISGIGAVSILTATLLIKKPESEDIHLKEDFNVVEFVKTDKTFLKLWFAFFLNITCGLAIISFEKNIVAEYSILISAGIVSSLSALSNTIGRIGFATWSDYLKNKTLTYTTFLTLCTIICVLGNLGHASIILALILIINLGYGGGFSSLPPIIADTYGVKKLSIVHGLALSAWGVAGLCGNSLSNIIINRLELGYTTLFYVLAILYLISNYTIYKINTEKL